MFKLINLLYNSIQKLKKLEIVCKEYILNNQVSNGCQLGVFHPHLFMFYAPESMLCVHCYLEDTNSQLMLSISCFIYKGILLFSLSALN